jgi:CheY-like chemotaxis protein
MTTSVQSILLAEDNANDVELTMEALRANHVVNEIVVVRDGAEALDYLCRRGPFAGRSPDNPGLILLDLKMPKAIPVVVLTSSREEHDVVRTYDLGVNAYVVKPVVFVEFMEAVRVLGQFWAVVNQPPPA